jgi:UDP-N-acetylglucosamine transferase subunit ALG13
MQFDRLVTAVDRWAAKNADLEVLAQIGRSQYRPMAMRWVELLPPNDYVRAFTNAEVVVSHAGMGTVISAAEHMKPLIVMPRRGDLRETRSDHQIHTARWLPARRGIRVVMDVEELDSALNARGLIESPEEQSVDRRAALIRVIGAFIESG